MARSSRSKAVSSATPPSVPTMGIREFVRGGIYDAPGPVTVLSNNTEMGLWIPRGQAAAYYSTVSSTTTPTFSGNSILRGAPGAAAPVYYNNVPMAGTATTTTSTDLVNRAAELAEQLRAYLNSEEEAKGVKDQEG